MAMARLAFLLLANSALVDQLPDKLSPLDQPILRPELGEGFLHPIVDYTSVSICHNQPCEVVVLVQ